MTTLIPKYSQGAAGAVNRPINQKFAECVSVKDFGAIGDGVADDTSAMQSAHNTGNIIYYPAGTYNFTKITMTSGGIKGDGQTLTKLVSTNNDTSDIIGWVGAGQSSYNGTSNGPLFERFTLSALTTKTGGGSLSLAPSIGEVSFATLLDITFQGGYIGFNTVAASHWNISRCNFINYYYSGVLVQNTNNNDSGDSTIEQCTFNMGIAGSVVNAGVRQISSGGLRIVNCKFLGGAYGYKMDAVLSKNVADLLIVGCSIENQSLAGIQFNKTSGAYSWGSIVISSNEFGNIPLMIIANDASNFLSDIIIVGNTFSQILSGQVGVTFDYNQDIYISSNKFSGSGTSTGISIGTNTIAAKIGDNLFRSIQFKFVNASSTTKICSGTQQSGTAIVVTNAVYGTFYNGNTTITFPIAYYAAPSVTAAIVDGAAGGISVLVGFTSATQVVLTVIGITNGASVNIKWSAIGYGE